MIKSLANLQESSFKSSLGSYADLLVLKTEENKDVSLGKVSDLTGDYHEVH